MTASPAAKLWRPRHVPDGEPILHADGTLSVMRYLASVGSPRRDKWLRAKQTDAADWL